MNRREALRTLAAGSAAGALAAGAVIAATPAPATEIITGTLADAIEAHRATIRRDETLYGDDCAPLADAATLEASDAAIGKAFAVMVAVPCLTSQDAAAKASYILAGSIGLREHGAAHEFLDLLIPEGMDSTDPNGPLVALLRSLSPTA